MSSQPTPGDRLRALMDADPIGDDGTTSVSELAEDEQISAALEGADLSMLSVEAQDLLLDLTASSASLEPAARGRIVEAAARALHRRRDDASPLPRLLFLARRDARETIEAVAADVAVSADLLLSVERGQEKIAELGAEAVATWVKRFKVPIEEARESILKTLRLETAGDRAVASASGEAEVEDSQFFRDVMTRLEVSNDEP
jgi:hypothetical protein